MPAQNESLPDAPSKIDQRIEASENTGSLNDDPQSRRARNIRDYHKAQAAEAQKTVDFHQGIVDEQNAMLGEDQDDDPEPLPEGTDIDAAFNGDGDEGDTEGDTGDDTGDDDEDEGDTLDDSDDDSDNENKENW